MQALAAFPPERHEFEGRALKRDLSALENNGFDLVVVGGGIFGVCAAWDATLRGLSVALVERGDFAHATSANSFKIVHGGIRYIQHLDVPRIRESSRERTALLRIAPHLVNPLPIVIPTYGHGMQGKAILRTGCLLYDALTLDRNRGIRDPAQRIPLVRGLSRDEVLTEFPGLDQDRLTGGVLFHDAQYHNPPRLALSFLRGAVERGAVAANYVEAVDFLRDDRQIVGVRARDALGGRTLDVRGKVVLNAAGPWAPGLLSEHLDAPVKPPLTFSRDACLIVPRRLLGERAVAVLAETNDPDAVMSRARRHLFIVPWRDYTLIGVWHVVYEGDPDAFTVTERELQTFLDEINGAYPTLHLKTDDVSMWNAGLVLFGENTPRAENLSYGKRSRIVDHQVESGLQGLISLVGVRFTTARGAAQKVVDMTFRKLGRRPPRSSTLVTPVFGGDIDNFADFLHRQISECPPELSPDVLQRLLENYGTAYTNVLAYVSEKSAWVGRLGGAKVIQAEVIHAVREEMAQTLADVVLRRTDLGTGEIPGPATLKQCADLMAAELGWDDARLRRELDQMEQYYVERSPSSRVRPSHAAVT